MPDADSTYTPERIRDISVRIYKILLGPGEAERMIEKDKDGGKKLRGRAAIYDKHTIAYLEVLGLKDS